MITRQNQFAMNLVGEDGHSVADADFSHLRQFLAAPHPSCRIMGIAEQHQFHLGIGRFALQVLKINGVAPAVIDQRRREQFAAIVAY